MFGEESNTSSGTPKGYPRHVTAVSHVLENNPWDMKNVKGKPVRFLLSTTNFRNIAPQFAIPAWKAGGTVVMPPPSSSGGFNAPGTPDAIEKDGVTTLLLMLHLLIDARLGQEPFTILKARGTRSEEEIKVHVIEMFGKNYSLAGVASLGDLGLGDLALNFKARILMFELKKRVADFRKNKDE
ncbi:hypothetical protein B0A55_02685 [Friedmanniomyces simplex]|uniref:Uncharacterized protein n=1 Tax=Friedmanniomyces simplex TaxID=329884 RepID=A0A4U0XSW9_9PEZI|nr:hypothetical protein B0A55_02685 [Friedmanniomyces simplex]